MTKISIGILIVALTTIFPDACVADQTDNAVVATTPSTNESIRMDWDPNAVRRIIFNEGVLHITDAGHKNEVWLYTTNHVYVIPDAIHNGKDIEAFRKEAENEGKKIPILFLD